MSLPDFIALAVIASASICSVILLSIHLGKMDDSASLLNDSIRLLDEIADLLSDDDGDDDEPKDAPEPEEKKTNVVPITKRAA